MGDEFRQTLLYAVVFIYHSFSLHCLEGRTRPILTLHDGQC